MRKVLAALMIVAGFAQAETLVFNDGRVHEISGIADRILIQNHTTWGWPTMVHILEGGFANRIDATERSRVYLLGGSTGSVYGTGNSITQVQAGEMNQTVSLGGSSEFFIEGGAFNTVLFLVRDSSWLVISGGSFIFDEYCFVDLYGEDASIAIHGEDFTLDGHPVEAGIYEEEFSGILGAKLKSGDVIEIPLNLREGSNLYLEYDPAPYCAEYPTMDFNKDCRVDMADLAEFASQWMVCNLVPQEACYR
jgi:hypothetical protein